MPSRYEPCGLGQMIALAYGTIPIVRATGGLADTITERGKPGRPQNGYIFAEYSSAQLLATLNRAIKTYKKKPRRWRKIMANAFCCDFSWSRSAEKYEQLYQAALAKHRS